jgi:hypothetical protein
MQCPSCSDNNETDAEFCTQCGRLFNRVQPGLQEKTRKAYWFALALIPVLIAVAWLGYYKFILPSGIVAVVNGEEVKLAELDAAAPRPRGMEEEGYRNFRYQALQSLILERLVLQEARAAAVQVSTSEILSAKAEARARSGLDRAAFTRQVETRFGSVQNFERVLMCRLLAMKILPEQAVAYGLGPQTAQSAVTRWLEKASGNAVVRIDLSEEISGAGCGCCSVSGNSAQGSLAPEQATSARDAGLAYWRAKHGPDLVTLTLKDYGCHIQIDIEKNDKIVKSLRYQGGTITEM